MTGEGRRQIVELEQERADEELRAAEQLLGSGLARIALTRTYFALFHALRALLYAADHEPRSHRGALSLFALHFVRTALYPTEVSRVLSRMQKFREDADYAEGFVVDDAHVRSELVTTRELVARLTADASARLAAEPAD